MYVLINNNGLYVMNLGYKEYSYTKILIMLLSFDLVKPVWRFKKVSLSKRRKDNYY